MITPDRVKLSPNFNKDALGRPLLLVAWTVIIHGTRSGVSMNPTEYEGTLNYMSRPGTTSSQWVISRTGEACRVVPDDHQAWHAGVDNDNTWGIELEQGAEQDGFTEPQIAKCVLVCKGYMQDFNIPATHAQTSSQHGFIGHQETAQGKASGKSDPGRLFPWADFMRRLKGEDELAGLARRNGNMIEFLSLSGFVTMRLGNEDGSDGSRIQVPEGDPANGGRWRTYKKSGAKMSDGSDIIVLE